MLTYNLSDSLLSEGFFIPKENHTLHSHFDAPIDNDEARKSSIKPYTPREEIRCNVTTNDTINASNNNKAVYNIETTNNEIQKNQLFVFSNDDSIFESSNPTEQLHTFSSRASSADHMVKKFQNKVTSKSISLLDDTAKDSQMFPNSSFPLAADCLIRCFCFLTFEEIMKTQILCKFFRSTVRTALGAFSGCKSLVLNSKWAKLPHIQREFYLRQMTEIRYLTVCSEAFLNDGMSIHEVASLVAQNVSTLRSLQLFSPENPLMDATPKHDIFEFVPLRFPRLTKLSMAGCQVLEWLHIFGNCDFVSVERFEVCYYPLPYNHWSWNVSHDFTKEGIHGLHKILDTMSRLERLTVGFDLWFEASPKPYPAEVFDHIQDEAMEATYFEEDFDLMNQYTDISNSVLPPIGGSSHCRSYRGKLSEEDFGDIFTIALVRSGASGSLKRVVMKYRMHETTVSDSEQLHPVLDFFEATASYCGKYISDVFAKISGDATE